MRNSTWICIPCRHVARSPGNYYSPLVVCPLCRNFMKDMGDKWEAPRKRDDVAWAKLALMVQVRSGMIRLCTCWSCTSRDNLPGQRASFQEFRNWLVQRHEHGLYDVPQYHPYGRHYRSRV